jgi:hypothetical protein
MKKRNIDQQKITKNIVAIQFFLHYKNHYFSVLFYDFGIFQMITPILARKRQIAKIHSNPFIQKFLLLILVVFFPANLAP